ncbi:MAG: EspA/EspE family type VII secretion system effector [Mycobacterium sp.]
MPVGRAEFDKSGQLYELRRVVSSAAPGADWTGAAAEAYAGLNERLAGTIDGLAELDRRLGYEVDRSAQVVAAGRRDLDSVKQWVMSAAASVPPNAAGERALIPVVSRGVGEVADILRRSNIDMNGIAARIRDIGEGYQPLVGREGRDGDSDDLDGQPPDQPPTKLGENAIPEPPPWTKHDEGADEWGSQPWYSRGDDLAFKAAIEGGLPLIEHKWSHAAELLDHYLDSTGDPHKLDVNAMMNDIPQMRARRDAMVNDEVNRIAAEVAATGQYGQPVPFRTPWQGYYMDPEANPDWYRAVGGVDMSAGGVVTVHPPHTPGGEPRVHVESQLNVADRYNWDEGKETKIGPITITDEHMAGLQTAGLAREFDITGASSVSTYDGAPR